MESMKIVGVREVFIAFASFTFRAQTRSRLPRALNREDMEGMKIVGVREAFMAFASFTFRARNAVACQEPQP
jgi:hypothetical protein